MAEEPAPDVQAVLTAFEAKAMPPTHGLSEESARENIEAFFGNETPEKVATTTDISFPGPDGDVPVRLYRPDADGPLPILLFFHGGGWVIGNRDCYDNVCTRLANRAECLVVSVEYRLAPEHPFPAAPKDCYAALEWVAEYGESLGGDTTQLAVAGDSAGGNLAAVVALMARDRDGPDIDHQGLVYPAVNPVGLQEFGSYEELAEGYFLEHESMEWFYERYVQEEIDGRNPYAFPLQANDLSELPPATIVSAGFDPLRDEDFAYEKRLDAAGVDVDHHHYEGMIHGFVSMTDELDTAEDAIDDLAANLRDAWD